MTRNLKEGLDLNKLSTTGVDFELIHTEGPHIEEEEEVEEKRAYQENVVQYLNPECVDVHEEGDEDSDISADNDNTMVSIITNLIHWGLVLFYAYFKLHNLIGWLYLPIYTC